MMTMIVKLDYTVSVKLVIKRIEGYLIVVDRCIDWDFKYMQVSQWARFVQMENLNNNQGLNSAIKFYSNRVCKVIAEGMVQMKLPL